MLAKTEIYIRKLFVKIANKNRLIIVIRSIGEVFITFVCIDDLINEHGQNNVL